MAQKITIDMVRDDIADITAEREGASKSGNFELYTVLGYALEFLRDKAEDIKAEAIRRNRDIESGVSIANHFNSKESS